MGDQKKVTIVGVPMDLGQMRRGVDMGPSAIRCAGVKENWNRFHLMSKI